MRTSKFLNIVAIVGVLSPTMAFAQEIESSVPGLDPRANDPDIEESVPNLDPRTGEPRQQQHRQINILDTLGGIIGSDAPNRRRPARDAGNIISLGSTVLDEFAGLNTGRNLGVIDLFLDLFRTRRRDRDVTDNVISNNLPSGFGDGSGANGGQDGASEASVIGAAGLTNPEALAAITGQRIGSTEGGGGAFGVVPVMAESALTNFASIDLDREAINVQLGELGQQLLVATAEQIRTASEGVNAVADEANAAQSSLDTLKLQSKQSALLASLAAIDANIAQETKIAALQQNKSTLRIQELMEQDHWSDSVGQSFRDVGLFKSAGTFRGSFE